MSKWFFFAIVVEVLLFTISLLLIYLCVEDFVVGKAYFSWTCLFKCNITCGNLTQVCHRGEVGVDSVNLDFLIQITCAFISSVACAFMLF